MMNHPWPELRYEAWKETYETLHRWVQIIGKIKLQQMPWTNHDWHVSFLVTSRGFTTSSIPLGDKNLAIDFDFIDHKLTFSRSDGYFHPLSLKNESVASFFRRVRDEVRSLGIEMRFDPHPNECTDYIPFDTDEVHRTYDKDQARRMFEVFVVANNLLTKFRAKFSGKCSPVHFFWGSFDLAVTRFSGQPAPEHPGVAFHISRDVMKEAYSHELSSCGFWPGNESYPHAAFYAYAYPEPHQFQSSHVERPAFYHSGMCEFVLPYEEVRKSKDAEDIVMSFFQDTFDAAEELGGWDKNLARGSDFLRKLQSRTHL